MDPVLAIRPRIHSGSLSGRSHSFNGFDLQANFRGLPFLAVIRMVISLKEGTRRSLPDVIGIFTGAAIGLLSGMIGIGGGIILSPLLLLFRWASLKEAAAVSALFIFVNSVSGLAGLKTWIPLDQSQMVYWLAASLVGGFLGARWGAAIASNTKVKWILALVLVIASLKLWFV